MDTIPLLPDFRDLLRSLNEEEVDYLVIGGMAVNYHGHHRSTGDLDLWVAVNIENEDRLARALRKFGFSEETVSRRPLLEKPKFIRIGEAPIRVEIHTEIAGVEFGECLPRSRKETIQGILVPFIGLEDLRKNKKAAGRLKDLADLEALSDSPDESA
jgi:predicted nucleotidyltransferase